MVYLIIACWLNDDKLNDRVKIWTVKFCFVAFERPDGHERSKKTIIALKMQIQIYSYPLDSSKVAKQNSTTHISTRSFCLYR